MMANSQAFLTFCCCVAWLSISTRMVNACSSSSQHELYKVVRKTDEGGKQLVVATDEDARLYCRTNVPWKKCWWKPPRNGVRELKCEFTKGPENRVTCPSFPEIHYDRQVSDQHEHNCAIVVENIQEHHEGNWKCEFEIESNPEETEEPIIIREQVKLLARGYRYI